jgi:hypothetical protein
MGYANALIISVTEVSQSMKCANEIEREKDQLPLVGASVNYNESVKVTILEA